VLRLRPASTFFSAGSPGAAFLGSHIAQSGLFVLVHPTPVQVESLTPSGGSVSASSFIGAEAADNPLDFP